MTITLLNVAAILFALVSAGLWALSAKVRFQFGYDMDQELQSAMNRASKLNAWGAAFAAAATFSQGAAMTVQALSKAC